jgi:Tfp pilus assembly protein PilE
MRLLITAAIFSVLALSPASAKMMACTTANIGSAAMAAMPEGQSAANKEYAAANTAVSNGKMRAACMHYAKAQKMSMAK